MLNSLISWSIQNRFIVLVLAAVLIFCGVHMSSKADIDVQQVLEQHLSQVFVDAVQIIFDTNRRRIFKLLPKLATQRLNVLKRIGVCVRHMS